MDLKISIRYNISQLKNVYFVKFSLFQENGKTERKIQHEMCLINFNYRQSSILK